MWLEDFQNTWLNTWFQDIMVVLASGDFMFQKSSNDPSWFPSPGLADAGLPGPKDPWDGEAAVVSEGSAVSSQRHCATNRLNMLKHEWQKIGGLSNKKILFHRKVGVRTVLGNKLHLPAAARQWQNVCLNPFLPGVKSVLLTAALWF